MDQKKLFRKVIFAGPQYKNYKGGIGAVLFSYARGVTKFNFVATYNGNFSFLRNLLQFSAAVSLLSWELLVKRSLKMVHLHGASKGSFFRMYLLFLLSKYFFRRKVVYHLHGGGFEQFYNRSGRRTKKMIHHLMTSSDGVICLSRSWHSYLKNSFGISNLYIINNPVLNPLKTIIRARQDGKVHFLFLGSIGEGKGIFDLLDVLAKLSVAVRDRLVLTIGGVGKVAELKETIKEKKLDSCVEYIGWVQGREKETLLSTCDVFVLPSYYEGLPISILEAMSYGKAILSTKVGGIPEIVKENENGFLFEPGDTLELRRHIERVVNNPSVLKKMEVYSRNKVKPYLINNVLHQLEAVYNGMLNG